MTGRFSGWAAVSAAVLLQYLLEVTLGRVVCAPAILVPLLVYMSISRGDYWAVEGAFWSGFMLDLLLHHPPGTSSISMLLGLAFSGWVMRVTTGAVRMTFAANAFTASIASDLIFILLASRPIGSGFSLNTLLIIPRIIVPIVIYLAVPLVMSGKIPRADRYSS